jgi:hypothetical protein
MAAEEYRASRTSTRSLKKKRVSPPMALAQWFDMNSDRERELHWLSVKRDLSASSLPNILLEHLHRSKYPDVCTCFSGSTTI